LGMFELQLIMYLAKQRVLGCYRFGMFELQRWHGRV
jgi:hypothetical protein